MKHLLIVGAAYILAGFLTALFSIYPADLYISDPRLPLQKGALVILVSAVTPIECIVDQFSEAQSKLLPELVIFVVSFSGLIIFFEFIARRFSQKHEIKCN